MNERQGKAMAVGLAGVVAVAPAVAYEAASLDAAYAQTPAPSPYSYNVSGTSVPPNAPHETHAANAIMVYGLGSVNCNYSLSSIESWTKYWLAQNRHTFTEVSPQSACGSINDYESLLNNIVTSIETYGTNPATQWAGLVLDEEGGFGFTASQLETLNTFAKNLMSGTPGISYVFQNTQPNSWLLATYDAIIAGMDNDPQVYTQSMEDQVNNECTTNGVCDNLVMVGSTRPEPWKDWSYVTSHVNGTSWYQAVWSTSHWVAYWRPT